jgi:hypothetical protein
MHLTIDREPRSPREGVALNFVARQDAQDIYQFKIDVWSEKGSGIYRLRLDGFNFVHNLQANSPQEIVLILARLDPVLVEAEAASIQTKIRLALSKDDPSARAFPDISELAVGEYFRAAQDAMLKELTPLLQSGPN